MKKLLTLCLVATLCFVTYASAYTLTTNDAQIIDKLTQKLTFRLQSQSVIRSDSVTKALLSYAKRNKESKPRYSAIFSQIATNLTLWKQYSPLVPIVDAIYAWEYMWSPVVYSQNQNWYEDLIDTVTQDRIQDIQSENIFQEIENKRLLYTLSSTESLVSVLTNQQESVTYLTILSSVSDPVTSDVRQMTSILSLYIQTWQKKIVSETEWIYSIFDVEWQYIIMNEFGCYGCGGSMAPLPVIVFDTQSQKSTNLWAVAYKWIKWKTVLYQEYVETIESCDPIEEAFYCTSENSTKTVYTEDEELKTKEL